MAKAIVVVPVLLESPINGQGTQKSAPNKLQTHRQAQTMCFEFFEQEAKNEQRKQTKQTKKQKRTQTDQSNKQNSSKKTKLKKQTHKTDQVTNIHNESVCLILISITLLLLNPGS